MDFWIPWTTISKPNWISVLVELLDFKPLTLELTLYVPWLSRDGYSRDSVSEQPLCLDFQFWRLDVFYSGRVVSNVPLEAFVEVCLLWEPVFLHWRQQLIRMFSPLHSMGIDDWYWKLVFSPSVVLQDIRKFDSILHKLFKELDLLLLLYLPLESSSHILLIQLPVWRMFNGLILVSLVLSSYFWFFFLLHHFRKLLMLIWVYKKLKLKVKMLDHFTNNMVYLLVHGHNFVILVLKLH